MLMLLMVGMVVVHSGFRGGGGGAVRAPLLASGASRAHLSDKADIYRPVVRPGCCRYIYLLFLPHPADVGLDFHLKYYRWRWKTRASLGTCKPTFYYTTMPNPFRSVYEKPEPFIINIIFLFNYSSYLFLSQYSISILLLPHVKEKVDEFCLRIKSIVLRQHIRVFFPTLFFPFTHFCLFRLNFFSDIPRVPSLCFLLLFPQVFCSLLALSLFSKRIRASAVYLFFACQSLLFFLSVWLRRGPRTTPFPSTRFIVQWGHIILLLDFTEGWAAF